MKKLVCLLVIMLAIGCSEDTGSDAVADTDIEQTDTGQADVEGDAVEADEPVILLDFDLESVSAECLYSEEKLHVFIPGFSGSWPVIVDVDQLNSGPIPFSISYRELVKDVERDGYAIVFKSHPGLVFHINPPEDAPARFSDTAFLLYEKKDGKLVKIGEQRTKGSVQYPESLPQFLDFSDYYSGIPAIDLLEGDYALEVQTGDDSAFRIAGQLTGYAYFVDLECLDL